MSAAALLPAKSTDTRLASRSILFISLHEATAVEPPKRPCARALETDTLDVNRG
jgi:hypothetical protein